MAQAIRIALVTLCWYGAVSALVIGVVAPWLHTGVGYPLQDQVTLPAYTRRATISALLGYPLLCAVLIFSAANRTKTIAGRKTLEL